MSKGIQILLSMALTLLALPSAFAQTDQNEAGLILFPSFSVRQATGTVGGNQVNYHINVRGGYRITSGWFFGMMYARQISNGDYAINQVAIGNSIGYFHGPFSFVMTYFLLSSHGESSPNGDIQRTEGQGYNADLSVMFPIAPKLTFGPTLTYKSLTFKKQETNTNYYYIDKHAETYLYPYLSLIYTF